jgi:hypothetical protein
MSPQRDKDERPTETQKAERQQALRGKTKPELKIEERLARDAHDKGALREVLSEHRRRALQAQEAVVLVYADRDGHASHFLMRASDDRLDGVKYVKVADVTIEKARVVDKKTGRSCRVAKTTGGRRYLVFSDWSCRELA